MYLYVDDVAILEFCMIVFQILFCLHSSTSFIATLLTMPHFYGCSCLIKHCVNIKRPNPMPIFLLLCGNVYEVVRPHLCTCAVCICAICSCSPFTSTCKSCTGCLFSVTHHSNEIMLRINYTGKGFPFEGAIGYLQNQQPTAQKTAQRWR